MVVFRIQIQVDTKNATQGTTKVNKGLERVRNNANKARGAVGRMFSVLVAAAAVRKSVQVLAEFGQAISTIAAVTESTGVDIERLTERAKQLGITTRFTATQAAEGLTLLARSGLDVNESMTAVGSTLQLAQAGALTLAQSTEIATDTLRAFNFEAEQMARVVDVMAKTSNATNTTVIQLGQALKFTAPIARGLGVSLEQTNAALGVLANAGQKASIGGTGLRRVMAALESPTAKALKTLKVLGLTADDVRISSVGLSGALQALSESGATTAEIFDIFGRRSGTAAAVLTNNIDQVKALDVVLRNAGGTAARMAEVMDDNLNGAMLRLRSAIEGSIIELGESGVTELLIDQFDKLANAVRAAAGHMEKVGAALRFMGLHADDAQANLRDLEKNSRLNELGAQITFAQRELNKLARIRLDQGFLTEAQLERVVKLEAAIKATKGQIRELADAEAVLNRVRQESQVTADNLIRRLELESIALQDVTEETKTQAQVQKDINRILLAGGEVTESQRERITALSEGNVALARQRKLLLDIIGPERELKQELADLTSLYERGAISAEQLAQAQEKLVGTDPIKDQLGSLRAANEELAIMVKFRGIEQQAMLIELQLRQQGKELTDAQRDALAGLLIERKKLNDELKKEQELARQKADAARKAEAAREADARRTANLIRQVDVLGTMAEKERELLTLREQQPLLFNEINAALDDLQLRALESSTALGDGFERAFIRMRREAEDFAAVGDKIANVFADSMTDALVTFAETGKFSFKEFASSMLKDITRIIARLLVMQAITAALGGVGLGAPAAGSAVLSGVGRRENGGTVQPDRSFIVGENGPELFTPGKTGSITPSDATMAAKQEPAPLNIQVVNVDDPDMVPQSISDGSSDEAIVNVISRNRDKLKGIL